MLPEFEPQLNPENDSRQSVRQSVYRLLEKKEGFFVDLITQDPWISLSYTDESRKTIPQDLMSFVSQIYPNRTMHIEAIKILFNGKINEGMEDPPVEETLFATPPEERTLITKAFTRNIRRFTDNTTPFQIILHTDCTDDLAKREEEFARDDIPSAVYLRNEHTVRSKALCLWPLDSANLCVVPQYTLDEWLKNPDHSPGSVEISMPYITHFPPELLHSVASEIDKASEQLEEGAENKTIDIAIEYT